MGKIDIFRNGFVAFCKSAVKFRNDPQCSVMLRYALYRLHAVREYILQRGSSDAVFRNDFGEDLLELEF